MGKGILWPGEKAGMTYWSFLIEFAFGKSVEKVTNGDYLTVVFCKLVNTCWAPKHTYCDCMTA